MRGIWTKIFTLLTFEEKRSACYLFILMVIMGIIETLGVGSIMPFLAILSDPQLIKNNGKLVWLYEYFDFSNENKFIVFIGSVVFILTVSSSFFKSITQWRLALYTQMRNCSISLRLISGYLGHPYNWFLQKNSAEIGKTLLSEVNQFVNQALMPCLQLISNSILVLFLVSLVIIVNPTIAICALFILISIYSFIYAYLRKYIATIGQERYEANKKRFFLVNEVFGGIKEIKLLRAERKYISDFQLPAHRFAHSQAMSQILGELPQYILRALAFGGMILLLLVLYMNEDGNLSEVLPIVALYALAGTRLLPAIQKIYQSIAKLRFAEPIIQTLFDDLNSCQLHADKVISKTNEQAIRLNRNLELKNITFTYSDTTKPVLNNINMNIKACTTVGIVGGTGAGKTTLIDIILGLLEAENGQVTVDSKLISSHSIRSWQKRVSYVPQHIYLSDDTIKANIAFGEVHHNHDSERIIEVAKMANLHDFIMSECSHGYDTVVGERGIRLSGGQLQRIGIARALYRDTDLLVMDEATSALDNITEASVMSAIQKIAKSKTIILVAHRLSTVKACDEIFVLERGNLIAQGNYEQLINTCSTFNQMASYTG